MSAVDLIDVVEDHDGCSTTHFSISGNGQYVAYLSGGPQGMTDNHGKDDIFVRNVAEEAPVRASTNLDGDDAGDHASRMCAMSRDGNYVAFMSYATNLVPNDTNDQGNPNVYGVDIFVRDLNAQPQTTTRVSTASIYEGVQAQSNGNSDHPSITPTAAMSRSRALPPTCSSRATPTG